MSGLKKIILLSFIFIFFNLQAYSNNDKAYEKIKLMIDIMEVIDKNYVSQINTKDLAVNAIKGMVFSLDPFSQYMEEKAFKDMRNATEGAYSGVGLRITLKNNFITVVSPLPGTPAYRAGILPNDRIIKIDKKSTNGMSTDEAVALMRGKAGKKVKLAIARGNSSDELKFDLVREKIKIETVRTTMLDDTIGYIRLSEFNIKSDKDIKKVLYDLKKQGMTAFILDLRNNPGGLLDSAINIISLFIEDKKLALTTKGLKEETKREYYTNGKADFVDIPFVVLVNRGSASASEIVSGALQDFRRALIIGSNTFGKGSVQTILPLSDGTALRLTIAKYYLPSGRPISYSNEKNAKNGITPDIYIPITIEEEVKLYAQSDVIFLNKDNRTTDQNKNIIEDKALNKAIEIIKEGKIKEVLYHLLKP
ncbi:MAG: S41 family peptidase [Endomicrobium sp.]|jgi:carboxyl-terminal processing protease|nr:S41 family peptidase [Endomicrobium sp.]